MVLLHITTSHIIPSVNSGIRATRYGYKSVTPYTIYGKVGYAEDKRYSAIFFSDGTHMTYQYGNGCALPKGTHEGLVVPVTIVGKYRDSEVACLVTTLRGEAHQPIITT